MRPFVVYMLRCADDSYYVGHTDDLDGCMGQHQAGDRGYTSTRRPLQLVWTGEFETREGALGFEQQVKGWSRAKKEALIGGDWEEIQRLARGKGRREEQGLRQAQPERSTARPERSAARPERSAAQPERSAAQPERSAAQPERSAAQPERKDADPSPVRPELVEGPGDEARRLRQAQPERGGAEPERGGAEPGRGGAEPERSGARPEREGTYPSPVRPDPSTSSGVKALVEGSDSALLSDLLGTSSPRRRRAIAKTITLLESTRADHRARADDLLNALLPHTGRSFRLGISGVPGVGKSTFIEVLGLHLIAQGHRVAVLAVDPSSSVSGGSILGDKTRMEQLSINEAAYIRPSPSSGTLGGVAERTRESLLVCEAAGYDIVIVETVGVGQSETAVAGMTDMFVLLQLPNAGDDLQAIKKGVMELADLVVINKADIDEAAATRARAQITSALRLFGQHGHPERSQGRPKDASAPSGGIERSEIGGQHSHAHHDTAVWHPKVLQLSALKATGLETFWQTITDYRRIQTDSGRLAKRRHAQDEAWMWERIDAGLKTRFRTHPAVREQLAVLRTEVRDGTLAASVAARRLLDLFQ